MRRAGPLQGRARRWSCWPRRRPTWPRRCGPAPRPGVPFVARGSGTGLSGGALPHADGVLVVTSRMRRILEVDRDGQRAVVEPGVINLQVTKAAAPAGYYYAPDPSSQQVCSIGGNVAENSGGAHCLKYGFTTNHVLGVELVTPDGEVVELGGKAPDAPGYDLLGPVVGSEGTLGIATRVTVRLVRAPGDGPDPAGRLPRHRRGRPGGVRDHRRRGDPGRDRDDGRAGHRGGGGGGPLWIPGRGGGGAGGRAGRAGGRGGGAVRRRGAVLPGARRGSRSGSPPTTRSGRCSGRGASPRSPRSAGSARTTSCRTG